jgi:hypothetical protein
LTLANVQTNNAGSYAVAVTNLYGATNSVGAQLTVTFQPPGIAQQPANQAVTVGASTTFSVAATGSPVLRYQWSFNGTNLTGATNVVLSVTNVQSANVGAYAVAITNLFGSTNSAAAQLTLTYPSSCSAPPSGMLGWWRAEGNTVDSSGSNNNASVVGNVNYAAGEAGQAFQFNGTNGYVQVGGSYAMNGARTIEAWVFPSNNTGFGLPIMCGGPGAGSDFFGIAGTVSSCSVSQYHLYVDHYGAACYDSALTVTPNAWNHVAMVYDGSVVRFYVNGVAGAATTAPLYNYNLNTYVIGGDTLGGTTTKANFAGLIDELAVYNRALASNEVAAIFAAGANGKCPPSSPVVVTNPASQTVGAGSNAVFAVVAAGPGTLTYQWRFSGTNLSLATNTSLTVSNVQPAHAGGYSVVVSNVYGSAVSATATLTLGQPPVITNQPVYERAIAGCTVGFAVGASGTPPLAYQWLKGSSLLAGQTNNSLLLNNVQTSDFTNYSSIINNTFGAATSSVVTLSLDHLPVAVQDIIQGNYSGSVKVQVSTLLANGTDPDNDPLTFTGVSSNSVAGGTVLWSGKWVYYTAPAGYSNSDAFTYNITDGYCGGVASGNVLIQINTPTGPSHNFTITTQPDGSVRLVFSGIPGWTYRVQYADTLPPVNWTDLSTNTADSLGSYQYVDYPPTNSPTRFYRSVSP